MYVPAEQVTDILMYGYSMDLISNFSIFTSLAGMFTFCPFLAVLYARSPLI